MQELVFIDDSKHLNFFFAAVAVKVMLFEYCGRMNHFLQAVNESSKSSG